MGGYLARTGVVVGVGDWIMASAQVKEANERTGKKVFLGDGRRFFYEKSVFDNNPRMAQFGCKDPVWVANYGGCRPYIKGSKDKHFIFNDEWRPTPGEIFFSEEELAWRDNNIPQSAYIIIEPNVKNQYAHGINKAWPYWEAISKMRRPFIQLGDGKGRLFQQFETSSFRKAMLVLSKADMFVGTDGGLHHAAAALGIPAVVIWTGFSSPVHLGYDDHINLHDGSDPCGDYSGPCEHCAEKARAIKPEQVMEAIDECSRLSRR